MERQPISGALLDLDGTFLDSNDAHAKSWLDALAEEGHPRPWEKVRRGIGMGADQFLPSLGIEDSSPPGKRISRRKKEIFHERYLPHLKPFPGSHDLLAWLKKRGVELVVATSSSGEELDALLRAARISDLIERATTASDAERSKPAPDIVEAAISRAGISPERLVMLGDTPYDVLASKRAGVRAIAVRCGGWSDEELQGAIEIHDDPAAILRDIHGSILGSISPSS